MSKTTQPHWLDVCHLDDIEVGTGICAKVNHQHVAIFRPYNNDTLHAISNIDPFAAASVLSRGFICEHKNELWVASPLKKQRFNLTTGICLEDDQIKVQSYPSKVEDQQVYILA